MSAERSILYGPALNRRIVTPARYLFVQAVDAHGRNFTESAGSGAFHAKIFLEQEGGQRLLLKSQLHDRGDGSYQIFFFYGIQPTKLIFHVTDKRGSFVGGKGPRVVKKPEVEQCDCPDPDPERWAGHYGCREREPQIARDFARFPRISRAAVREIRAPNAAARLADWRTVDLRSCVLTAVEVPPSAAAHALVFFRACGTICLAILVV